MPGSKFLTLIEPQFTIPQRLTPDLRPRYAMPKHLLRYVTAFVHSVILVLAAAAFASAQSAGKTVYSQLSTIELTKAAQLNGETINVDRATITMTGTIYFSDPVNGKHTGAVFIGTGNFSAPVPDSAFEKANVRRLLKADVVESNFTNAVFRTTDGSLDAFASRAQQATPPAEAQKLAAGHDARIRQETGANLASRMAVSLANAEKPGFFFASFDGGKMDDFSFVFDPQTRIPTSNFDLNGGEKGIVFHHISSLKWSEILMAVYNLDDYAKGTVGYSDTNDLVDIEAYDTEIDLRSPKSKIGVRTTIKMTALQDGVSVVPFSLGESLSAFENERLKKQLRLSEVKFAGRAIDFAQEDWEGGFTVFLPAALKRGDSFEMEMTMHGDFLEQPDSAAGFSYPRSTTSWYPRHGYLDRSEYKIKFVHSKKLKVACVGSRLSEAPSPENPDHVITQYHMSEPVALVTFALGPFKRYNEIAKWDGTEDTLPLEFNSIGTIPLKEDFVVAELSNSVRYFHKLFGAYPYKTYSASYHPYGFGQGFPSMLMIPSTDRANKYTYSFVAHETAHQWWGNIVAWRSYRDQWLSEGFAEYSGVLYTGVRDSPKASINLIDNMRASLRRPPETQTGVGKGRLNDVGPIILGHRLNTSKTFGGYQTLVYNKGALVLRMLHFLFTDPSTGVGDPFYDMMKDFVNRHRNGTASTDDFRVVANEHFAKTPIAKLYKLRDLNWFFQQWVYETHLPSFTLEHTIEPQPDGSVLLSGFVLQKDAPDNFFMPLPLLIRFGDNRMAMGTVAALGPKAPFKIKLPAKPQKVELDPNSWVLSESTSTK